VDRGLNLKILVNDNASHRRVMKRYLGKLHDSLERHQRNNAHIEMKEYTVRITLTLNKSEIRHQLHPN
jgi:hypothetical protein